MEPKADEGEDGRWQRIARGLFSRIVLLKSIIIAGAVFILFAAFLYASGNLRLAFYPFETSGVIHVESPQVYTRERLVNDRYSQDHWLKGQLKALDDTKNLMTGISSKQVNTGLSSNSGSGTGVASSGGAQTKSLEEPMAAALPFDQEFRIRSGIRDAIRESVLENMLDDRHDLRGNTIYGLKFDTTVIPGVNTFKRAFVQITLSMQDLLSPDPVSPEVAAPNHVKLYFDSDLESIMKDKNNKLFHANELYQKWLENVQFRLNNYVSRYFMSDQFHGECSCDSADSPAADAACKQKNGEQIADTTRAAFDAVLAIEGGFGSNNAGQNATASAEEALDMPQPWSDYLTVFRLADAGCPSRFHFVVKSVTDSVYVSGDPASGNFAPGGSYVRLDKTKDNLEYGVFNKFPLSASLSYDQFNKINIHYPISPNLVTYVVNHTKSAYCLGADQAAGTNSCPTKFWLLSLPSGFFKFMESIINTDAYSYAISPKSDSYGMLMDSVIGASVSQDVGSGSNAWADYNQRLRQTSALSRVVGFGDGQLSGNGNVTFSWVIARPDGTEPVQASQLALVSVPAWTGDLKVKVTTGWLDRNSAPTNVSDFDMNVPLPTDFEAFDTFVGGSLVRRQPKILDAFLDSIQVEACSSASILIPGYRLWRSAVVTLGSQEADQIIVLPNMQGIIAKFNMVEMPAAKASAGFSPPDRVKVNLRVWTSEGMAGGEGANEATIMLPTDPSHSCYKRNGEQEPE